MQRLRLVVIVINCMPGDRVTVTRSETKIMLPLASTLSQADVHGDGTSKFKLQLGSYKAMRVSIRVG